MLANPPFGVEWKKVADPIKKEHAKQGSDLRQSGVVTTQSL
jgi:hypothetical protein